MSNLNEGVRSLKEEAYTKITFIGPADLKENKDAQKIHLENAERNKKVISDLIDRAVSLGGKFVRDRVEDAIRLVGNDIDLDRAMKEVRGSSVIHSSASQALSELEKNLV